MNAAGQTMCMQPVSFHPDVDDLAATCMPKQRTHCTGDALHVVALAHPKKSMSSSESSESDISSSSAAGAEAVAAAAGAEAVCDWPAMLTPSPAPGKLQKPRRNVISNLMDQLCVTSTKEGHDMNKVPQQDQRPGPSACNPRFAWPTEQSSTTATS